RTQGRLEAAVDRDLGDRRIVLRRVFEGSEDGRQEAIGRRNRPRPRWFPAAVRRETTEFLDERRVAIQGLVCLLQIGREKGCHREVDDLLELRLQRRDRPPKGLRWREAGATL